MTRINLVDPKLLTDQHLLAEFREIARLPKNLQQSLNRKSKQFSLDEIPKEYVLGKGHVKFFFNKFKFLQKRYESIVEELHNRGINIKYTDSSIFQVYTDNGIYYQDYEPTYREISRSINRLIDKVNMKPKFYKLYKEAIPETYTTELRFWLMERFEVIPNRAGWLYNRTS